MSDYKWNKPEDEYHRHARVLLERWAVEINIVGMMSLNRDYLKGLTINYLESKLVAETLVDLLAAEFRHMATTNEQQVQRLEHK